MVFVTHDQVEAMTLASRIVVMRGGVIQQTGAPNEVYERPQNLFVAGFLGAPGMNFIEGTLQAGPDGPRFVSEGLALELPAYPFKTPPAHGQPVVLGLRPEHLQLTPGDGSGACSALGGRVQLVEPMGNHQVVWVERGGLQLAALMHDAKLLQPDQAVSVSIDAGRLSLFDRQTEQRL